MPVEYSKRPTEAHRALELLEEYHQRLNRPEDRQLREAIERVITIFKSRLFQALLDIQEFYEETLLNERKSLAQKTNETQQIASRWEKDPPIVPPALVSRNNYSTNLTTVQHTKDGLSFIDTNQSNGHTKVEENYRTSSSSYNPVQEDHWRTIQVPVSIIDPVVPARPAISSPNFYSELRLQVNGNGTSNAVWEYENIVLEKGTTGLGFSIAGGKDNPHVGNDPSIYVTKVIEGGAAFADSRLKKDDIILKVNLTDSVDVNHHVAVDALKRAGNVVQLYVKRNTNAKRSPSPNVNAESSYTRPVATTIDNRMSPRTPQQTHNPNSYSIGQQPAYSSTSLQRSYQQSYETKTYETNNTYVSGTNGGPQRIDLVKSAKGLGFSIAGGIGNEHIPGDTGIYVTKIIDGGAAQLDGRLQVGDKILSVDSHNLENVPHLNAVSALKETGDRVTLFIIPNPHPEATAAVNNSLDHSVTPPIYHPPPPPSAQRVPSPVRPQPFVTSPIQPPVSYAPENIEPILPVHARQAVVNKGPTGLGFNIVGGEDGQGIFISYILPGGAADLSGVVFKGDQLLEVNGVDLRRAHHDTAANELKHSGQQVQLVVQHRPEDYARFEAKIEDMRNEMITQGQMPMPQPRREMYIRSLFDYDPSKDSGLPSHGLAFQFGDILHVTNASDDDWWQARRVLNTGQEQGYGIIPSKRRIEKRERARRKQVNFFAAGSRDNSLRGSKRQLSFSSKFPFMKSKEKLNEGESDTEIAGPDEAILSYEAVEHKTLNYVRPVMILGALKDRINDDLLAESPDKYASCIPHTCRPRREHENDGRDYHFVSRDQMQRDIENMHFIEAGQYNGNLYGTSVHAVKFVSDQSKHCVLDVSGNAIRRLQNANLYPIAIFVRPYDRQQLMEWNRRLTDEQAEREMHRYQQMEQEFASVFTSIIQGDTPEDIYAQIKAIIREQSQQAVWIPSTDML